MDTQVEKLVYFVMQTARDDNGWIPCICKGGDTGYWKTDWRWDCTFEEAEKFCQDRNDAMGISAKEAMMIQLKSMFGGGKNGSLES